MKLTPQTVYVPIDFSDKKPIDGWVGCVFTIRYDGITGVTRGYYNNNQWHLDNGWDGETVTHWLEKQQNQYILSKEELIELLKIAYNTGAGYTGENGAYQSIRPTKEQFINNILNQ